MEDSLTQTSPAAYLALGFLAERPAHAYELRERLRQGLGSLWHVATSQLYAVLHRLEAEGLVRSTITEGRGAARFVYTLTERGEGALWQWAEAPVGRPRDLRGEFLAKVYFLRRLAPERLPALLRAESRCLERLRQRLADAQRVLTDDPEVGHLAASFRLTQVESALSWLERARQAMDKERR
jgi:DNA-binding PadR family transcriptional regulator